MSEKPVWAIPHSLRARLRIFFLRIGNGYLICSDDAQNNRSVYNRRTPCRNQEADGGGVIDEQIRSRENPGPDRLKDMWDFQSNGGHGYTCGSGKCPSHTYMVPDDP